MIIRDSLDNGLCLITESMPDVRSVSLGVWLVRGSRHEGDSHAGIAHFTEHMLFKGTTSRSAEVIAQEVDSVGGQLDAFTGKEYVGYYIKVLDEHLPRAVDLLSDLLSRPAFNQKDIAREKKVILEEIKMVEDMPDDLVYELFTESFWPEHPLGRSILGSPASIDGITSGVLRDFFERVYVPDNLVIVAAGNIHHETVHDLIQKSFNLKFANGELIKGLSPQSNPDLKVHAKDIEQSHVCFGLQGYSQDHEDRYASYILNTVLGGSMSSRLFQNVREKRGLAYAISSGLISYRDVGTLSVYAGCDASVVSEVVDLVVKELRTLKNTPISNQELTRAKDHLKGNLVLGLESTTSRMSQLAHSEIYFGRQIKLSENLLCIDQVTADDVQRVSTDLFSNHALGVTVLGPNREFSLSSDQLDLG